MRHRWFFLYLILGWSLFPSVVSGQAVEEEESESHQLSTTKPAQRGTSSESAPVVQHIISRTNAFRQEEGHQPVEANPQLMATAQDFANFMARTGKYGHTADGHSPATRAQQHDYDACLIAENIAYQYSSTGFASEQLAQGFFQGWQHSPGHRKNMLNPAVTETGVAVAQSEQTGYYYAVQLFGRPQSQRLEFQITNHSTTEIPYAIGDRTLPLPPQYTRTHQRCRPVTLTFQWPDKQESTTVEPQHGARYVIVQGDAGKFTLQEE
jgi:uncharacterized protein YkwD